MLMERYTECRQEEISNFLGVDINLLYKDKNVKEAVKLLLHICRSIDFFKIS